MSSAREALEINNAHVAARLLLEEAEEVAREEREKQEAEREEPLAITVACHGNDMSHRYTLCVQLLEIDK